MEEAIIGISDAVIPCLFHFLAMATNAKTTATSSDWHRYHGHSHCDIITWHRAAGEAAIFVLRIEAAEVIEVGLHQENLCQNHQSYIKNGLYATEGWRDTTGGAGHR